MNILKLLTLASLGILVTISCTQFEDIGSDLVDGDQILITTDTDVEYEMQTFQRDSLLAYVRQGLESDYVPLNHILGQIDEPVFGHLRYNLTAQVQFSRLGINFEGASFDSAFLMLSYDTTFAPYGDIAEMQTLDVYELETRELPERIYVTDDFATKPGMIGSLSFTPSYKNQNRGDSLTAPSHIRIPMSMEFGQKILDMDTSVTSSVLEFLDVFPGFVVRPRENSFGGAYRFFAYASGSAGQIGNSEVAEYSGIRIYYTQDGESKEAYLRMSTSLHHFTTVEHDFEGSQVEKALNERPAEPEYVYIQPTTVGVRLDFTDLSTYKGKVINDVSLTWSVAGHPMDDTTIYQPMLSIFALEKESVLNRRPISDILAYQSGGAYRQYFGGDLQKNDSGVGSKYVYTFNITNQFQHMVDGSSDPVIFVVPPPQDVSRINRSVIYGPGIAESSLQPKIKITYSSTQN